MGGPIDDQRMESMKMMLEEGSMEYQDPFKDSTEDSYGTNARQ